MNHFWKWVRNRAPDAGTAGTGLDQDGPDRESSDQEGSLPSERTLVLNGTIAEDSWFDDEVTPGIFKDELNKGTGPITVWINSPGGDVFAAAQIYNMLLAYPGKITVQIDSIAASAATVIAMAGDTVRVTPTSMLMVHNPSTIAMGDKDDMQKAIETLDAVKESILNAYETKTGLSRHKLSKLMDEETWMDSTMAIELGFADELMMRPAGLDAGIGQEIGPDQGTPVGQKAGAGQAASGRKMESGQKSAADPDSTGEKSDEETKKEEAEKDLPEKHKMAGMLFSTRKMEQAFTDKVREHYRRMHGMQDSTGTENGTTGIKRQEDESQEDGSHKDGSQNGRSQKDGNKDWRRTEDRTRSVDVLERRLDFLHRFI